MIKVLDHGYVNYIGHYGSEEEIIAAARMSTQKGFQGWGSSEKPGDEKLLRYLWTHGHTSPFEMAGLHVEVQCPIFVARQIFRHRTFSYNEASARYAPLPELDYLPTVERLMMQSKVGNTQTGAMKGAKALNEVFASAWQELLRFNLIDSRRLYAAGLAAGIPQELARGALTVNAYTRFRMMGNLKNWTDLLRKRLPGDAQWETRQFSEAILTIATEHFPRTGALFAESRAHA